MRWIRVELLHEHGAVHAMVVRVHLYSGYQWTTPLFTLHILYYVLGSMNITKLHKESVYLVVLFTNII